MSARVHQATDKETGRQVAIKIIDKEGNQSVDTTVIQREIDIMQVFRIFFLKIIFTLKFARKLSLFYFRGAFSRLFFTRSLTIPTSFAFTNALKIQNIFISLKNSWTEENFLTYLLSEEI